MAAIDAERYLDNLPDEIDESTDLPACSVEPAQAP
jgi:hypothetical protein